MNWCYTYILMVLWANPLRCHSEQPDEPDQSPTVNKFDGVEPVALSGHRIPVLRMMKRQLRNFRNGETARLTLVFHASRDVQIRWFIDDPTLSAKSSEIPHMLPAEGNPNCHLSRASSGDVTAATISSPNFRGPFPARFVCIISTLEGTLQYEMRTIVRKETSFQQDSVDGPEWLVIPPSRWNYSLGGNLKVQCKVFVPYEKNAYTNELVLFKAVPITKDPALAKVDFDRVIGIHQDTVTYAEEHGVTILQGMRKVLNKGHAFYEVRMSTSNATAKFEGLYQCVVERQFDKMYALSYATIAGNRSLFPSLPSAHLVLCESDANNMRDPILVLRKNHVTCIRCRGFASPKPTVALYKGESRVLPDENISTNSYINIADAGVSETVYVFRKPSAAMAGRYSCRAINAVGRKKIHFTITYRDTTY